MTTEEALAGEIVDEQEPTPLALVQRPPSALVARDELSVEELIEAQRKIERVMREVMKPEIHYGHIPGVEKPTLFKPGAEILCRTFRLAPSYPEARLRIDRDGDGHQDVTAVCVLTHINSGTVWAEGLGSCSTRENKYGWRNAKRVCPACGAAAIIKGKAEYGGGWLCWKKEDGCGAKYADGDPAIEGQEAGKVQNPDLADTYNTVLKMAAKRALVAAVLNATAASDTFTQDVEDMAPRAAERPQEAQRAPRTADGQDTRRDGPQKPSPAQLKKAHALLEEIDRADGFDMALPEIVHGIAKYYKVEMTEPDTAPDWLGQTLGRLTGGGKGQISDLIERLEAKQKAAAS